MIPRCDKENIPYLILDVGMREDWKNPDHIMRKHPKFRLNGVPAICMIEN